VASVARRARRARRDSHATANAIPTALSLAEKGVGLLQLLLKVALPLPEVRDDGIEFGREDGVPKVSTEAADNGGKAKVVGPVPVQQVLGRLRGIPNVGGKPLGRSIAAVSTTQEQLKPFTGTVVLNTRPGLGSSSHAHHRHVGHCSLVVTTARCRMEFGRWRPRLA
jgi:hypothetical protein